MGIQGQIRAAAGTFARIRVRRQLASFLAAAQDCRQTQSNVLKSLLALNAGSDFARQHSLETVRTPEDLANALPVTNYDFYRSSIERLKRGDERALLGTANRLLMFTLSSGTTADSKFIPVTSRFLSDYRHGWQTWGIGVFDAYPKLRRLKMLTLSSDNNRFTTETGIPCGNISGLAASMQSPSVQLIYTLPYIVAKITDPEAKYYTTLRLAMADAEVGMVTTANPSTLVHLANLANNRRDDLIRDIHDGTLACRDSVPREVIDKLGAKLRKPSRRRAKFLEQCVDRTGTLYPRDFWPELQMLAVWTGGSCAAYIPSLKHAYGNVPVRDHGLSASEGRMTLPFQDESSAGVLDITTHYFEFIPEAQYGSPNPAILQAHELDAGSNYFILLTTSSGFFRYDICDVVQCTGFEGTTPILRFLHKGSYISNITGEKLSESQVVEAMRSTLDIFGHRVECFTVAPVWGTPPGYRLLLEDREHLSSDQMAAFESQLDERLQEINCEYQEKRETGRLTPLKVLRLQNGSWAKFARERQTRLGGSIEQYKHPCLLSNLDVAARVCEQFAMELPDDDWIAPPVGAGT